MSEWQPIETAPTDGTKILAWVVDKDYATENGAQIIYAHDNFWVRAGDDYDLVVSYPTHWMELPPKP